MKWLTQHIQGGVLVAAQTTGGGFKDVLVLSQIGDNKWAKISLLDGFCSALPSAIDMADWLNKHRFVPISKTVTEHISVMTPPENRLGLPQVQIISLRNKP